jgi:hypothetical protein
MSQKRLCFANDDDDEYFLVTDLLCLPEAPDRQY